LGETKFLKEHVMQRFLSWTLAIALLTGLAGASLSAVERMTERAATTTPMPVDEIALLPASDLIAVVNVNRFFGELLPKIKADAPAEIAKATKEMEEFSAQTGIDLAKVKTAVIGVKLDGQSGSGAAILQGLSFDAARIEATVKSKNGEFKTTDYKGRPIYTVKMKAAAQVADAAAAAGVPLRTGDEMNFAALDGQTAVAGDLAGVKSVLDAQSGGGNQANAGLNTALKDTKASGLVRFAANLPESLRQGLSSQGDLFQQIAAIKMIFGSFDLAGDMSAALDATLRTGSKDDATQLETGLKSLVFLGKSFLGGNQDPQMQAINQLLDQIKISAQTSDVSLSIMLPRTLMNQFTTPAKKLEPPAKSPASKQ
jgi:hypothetical protein